MGKKTGIAWTTSTWNPVRGCSRISEGCRFCYAELVAARYSGVVQGKPQPYHGLAKFSPSGKAQWTGKIAEVERHLNDPLHWEEPRYIFTNSMSDLFHESLDPRWIDKVMDVMLKADHHIFQVLTKRADVMQRYLQDWVKRACWPQTGTPIGDKVPDHIWMGISVEDQDAAEKRMGFLRDTPAAFRWLSVEPQIGPVDLSAWPGTYSWVVIGGESGPTKNLNPKDNVRKLTPEWARDLMEQCRNNGVPIFFKQLGSAWAQELGLPSKGDEPENWPEEFRVREFPDRKPRVPTFLTAPYGAAAMKTGEGNTSGTDCK